jgi:glycosyltransferase 2 family protein
MSDDRAALTTADDSSPVPTRARRGKALAIKALKVLLLVLVGYGVGKAMVTQARELSWDQIHVQPAFLTLSILAAGLASLLSAISYRMLMNGFVRAPSLAAICTVCWIPILGKYLPGKVASVAGAIYMLKRYGVPTAIAASVVMVQQALAVLTGLMVALPLCFWKPVHDRAPLAWVGCLVLAIAGLAVLHPRILGPIINRALRWLRRDPLPKLPPLRLYLPPVALQIVSWMVSGVVAWLTTRGIVDLPVNELPIFTAATALAASLGALALIPGGLGVREGVLLLVLTPLTGPVATVVVVVLRLQSIVVELLMAGLALLLVRRLQAAETENGRSQPAVI